MEHKHQDKEKAFFRNLGKKKVLLILTASGLLLIIGVICFIRIVTYNDVLVSTVSMATSTISITTEESFVPVIQNELFVATMNNETRNIDISIINPVKNEVLSTHKIILGDWLAPSSSNAWGANDSVQYNATTKEIFLYTEGSSAYDGSCTNKDGTCFYRLYKVALGQSTPVVIFESSKPILNWTVISSDNSLLFSVWGDAYQSLTKIRQSDGSVVFTKEYPIKAHQDFANFVVSRDRKYVYQASRSSDDGRAINETLSLRKINIENGDLTEDILFTGDFTEYETYLSPDSSYVAFHSNGTTYYYSLAAKKLTSIPYVGSIGNYNLHWSGDSKKILLLLKDSLVVYDISSGTSTSLGKDLLDASYVYIWGPSTEYFVYLSEDSIIKLFTFKNKTSAILPIDIKSEVKGVSLY